MKIQNCWAKSLSLVWFLRKKMQLLPESCKICVVLQNSYNILAKFVFFRKQGNCNFSAKQTHCKNHCSICDIALSTIVAGIISSVQLYHHQHCVDENPLDPSVCYERYKYQDTIYVITGQCCPLSLSNAAFLLVKKRTLN